MAKSEQEQTTDIIPAITEIKEIKSLIYVVRGQQVGVLHCKWLKLIIKTQSQSIHFNFYLRHLYPNDEETT